MRVGEFKRQACLRISDDHRVQDEKGNALFLILIAVALFAALSYAVTQTGRGSGGSSKEQVTLEIARINDFASQIQSGLQRLSLIQNTPEYLVDYHDPAPAAWCAANDPITANSFCTSNTCRLYDPQGGGVASGFVVSPQYRDTRGGAEMDAGCPEYWNITVNGVGQNNQNDMVLELQGITKAFCIAWNNYAGIVNPGGNPPQSGNNAAIQTYGGNINAQVTLTDATVWIGNADGSNITGASSFCTQNSWNSDYRISIVLIPR